MQAPRCLREAARGNTGNRPVNQPAAPPSPSRRQLFAKCFSPHCATSAQELFPLPPLPAAARYVLLSKFSGEVCPWCIGSALLSFSIAGLAASGMQRRELADAAGPELGVAATTLLVLSLGLGHPGGVAAEDLVLTYKARAGGRRGCILLYYSLVMFFFFVRSWGSAAGAQVRGGSRLLGCFCCLLHSG